MRLVALSLASLVLAPLVACGSDAPDDEVVNCDLETTTDDFVVGLTKSGDQGIFEFSLMSFTPAPPSAGENAWNLKVMSTGASAAPVIDAVMDVIPFMPKHQHGPGEDPVIAPATNAGEYDVSKINLWMPGIWEVTIEATSGGRTDQAVFRTCIPS